VALASSGSCSGGRRSRLLRGRSAKPPFAAEAYCRGIELLGRAVRRSLGAARFIHDCKQAPTTGMRGRERLAGRKALPASGGLERIVVGVGALALLGGNPTQEHSFRRGVVDATRVHGGEQIADAVVELLSLPFAVARADAMGDHVGVGLVAERLVDGRERAGGP